MNIIFFGYLISYCLIIVQLYYYQNDKTDHNDQISSFHYYLYHDCVNVLKLSLVCFEHCDDLIFILV